MVHILCQLGLLSCGLFLILTCLYLETFIFAKLKSAIFTPLTVFGHFNLVGYLLIFWSCMHLYLITCLQKNSNPKQRKFLSKGYIMSNLILITTV